MKFYISSFKIGDDPNKLKELLPAIPKAVYISSGLDFANADSNKKHTEWDLRELSEIGVIAEHLDLRDYFSKVSELRHKFNGVNLIYVSGGNVYDLRRAMQLSGFDTILTDLLHTDLVYAGYSAAGCVLSPTLKGYHVASNPDLETYGKHETIWEGLHFVDWQFAPHFESDHGESEDINQEIEYYKEHDMKYQTLRDGEVLIFETTELVK